MMYNHNIFKRTEQEEKLCALFMYENHDMTILQFQTIGNVYMYCNRSLSNGKG